MKFTEKTTVAVELWLSGMIGVFTLSIFVLHQILSGLKLPVTTELAIVISTVQSSVFLAIAAWVGSSLSRKVSLSTSVAQALATGRPIMPALGFQVRPGIVGGIFGAAILLAATESGDEATARRLCRVHVDFVDRATEFAEGISPEIFDRDIPQMIILHANKINGDW
jgi:hypothetical protein